MQMFSQNFFAIFNKIWKESQRFIGNYVKVRRFNPPNMVQGLLHF